MRRRTWSTVAAVCASLVAPAAAHASAGDLVLVANPGNPGHDEVAEASKAPAISADGRFVAYIPSLEGEDPLILRDLRRGTTTRVFASSEEPGARFGWEAEWASISASGRYIAFSSNDPALSEDDDRGRRGYGVADVFVYDRLRRGYTLASRRSGVDGVPGNSHSTVSSISYDGHRVAYETEADNLVSTRPETIGGVFERDLRTELNEVVSAEPGIEFWRPGSWGPALSGDGRRVAYVFQYSRTPYDPKHPPPSIARWLHRRNKQIMLTDPAWTRPRVISRAAGLRGQIADENCREPSVSATGRFVAFTCDANNLVAGDRNRAEDVFVRDVRNGRTMLVSRVGRGGRIGDGGSSQPSISGDGRYVAFTTEAANLVPGDRDEDFDVLVKDLRTGRLVLASRGLGGKPADGRSGVPAISADGRFLAFYSNAKNLMAAPPDPLFSVYRLQLLP
jgi:hypothetical protein